MGNNRKKTAAEIIYSEADASKLYMGLSTWKDAPNGKIQKTDVSIAKNYLNDAHLQELNKLFPLTWIWLRIMPKDKS